MLPVIKCVVNNIIRFSATQLMHAPAHGVHRTVQQLLCKTLNFISPELWPPTRPEMDSNELRDLGSQCQREYEFQVNKIEEIKQRLVELWKSSNTTFE